MQEARRKSVHMLLGVALLLFYYACTIYFGPENARIYSLAFAFLLFFLGLVVSDQKLLGKRVPLVDELIVAFERPNVQPGRGAFWFAIGALLLLSFLKNPPAILASLFILTFSDGFSSIAGVLGKHSIPHNRIKTFEGALVFFLTSCLTYFFIGSAAFPLALLTTLVESANLHLDDNATVPLACIVFFALV